MPALGATGAHGQVLDDPVLHVVEAGVVGVEHLAGARRGRSVSSVRTVHGISRTVSSQVRIQPASGVWSLARSSLPTSRSAASRTFSGQVGGLDAGAVVVGALGLVLAELLADRGELLAQQELALALLHALADVVAGSSR